MVTEYAKIFFYVPNLLVNNIVGTVIVSTLLGPIWGIFVIIISDLIFNSFGIGQKFMLIILISKLLEPTIIGIINHKKNKKICRVIITIFILSFIIPFVEIIASTYTYQYTTEVYNFIEHIKISITMYLEFLKNDYLNNLSSYILSFIISTPILYLFNKKN
ncbi:hypothetical protein [Clostridium oceanicum]|uniref:Uncharacterized protein n=1 Tax=Clostridium oceanicum TaxID=1543 RepID=A0ABP3UQB0_9CLOT